MPRFLHCGLVHFNGKKAFYKTKMTFNGGANSNGVVFKSDTSGIGYKNMLNFSLINGDKEERFSNISYLFDY